MQITSRAATLLEEVLPPLRELVRADAGRISSLNSKKQSPKAELLLRNLVSNLPRLAATEEQIERYLLGRRLSVSLWKTTLQERRDRVVLVVSEDLADILEPPGPLANPGPVSMGILIDYVAYLADTVPSFTEETIAVPKEAAPWVTSLVAFTDSLVEDLVEVQTTLSKTFLLQQEDCAGRVYNSIAESLQDLALASHFVAKMYRRLVENL
jgi:hypothetical protein